MKLSIFACWAVVALASSGAVQAQSSAAPAPASGPVFAIRGFNITGDNPLPAADTTRVLAPFLRNDATLETLQKASLALETALREKGFALHRVALPPQEVGQVVALNVVKFVIGKVTVEGVKEYSQANIRASLPELAEGAAPNFRALAVQTAIANESQGKQVQVSLKESQEADQIDAKVIVKEGRPWNFSASLANTGSAATGNDRFTLAGSHANVFGLDHNFTGAYTTSLERPADVKQIGLNYRMPLYKFGGVAGLSYTKSDVLGNFGAFTSTGAGRTLGINYNHYLPPSGGYRGYVGVSADDKVFNATLINGVAVQSARRSRPLTLTYNARAQSDAALWGYNLDLAVNLDNNGSGNNLAAYKTEDARISTAAWKTLRGGANYLTGFGGGWLWSMKGQFQYSPDALISGEQFGLGGAGSVRGTSERPIAGDSGVFVSTEISTKELTPGLRLVGFVDAGLLANNNPNGNPKPARDTIASTGLGLRFTSPASFALSAEYGRVINGSNLLFAPNSGIPKVGDEKLHVNFTARF